MQVGDAVKDALIEITVLGAEAPIEAVDAQGAIRYLNRMMAGLDARGIDLGYTEVKDFADVITVPAGADEGIVFLLATKLWNQYTDDAQPIPSALVAMAKDGLNTMRVLAVDILPTQYPDTLPIGSGNEGENTFNDIHFYPGLDDVILAETTGSIALEDSTNG